MGVLLLCDKPSLGSFILNSHKSYISISSAVLLTDQKTGPKGLISLLEGTEEVEKLRGKARLPCYSAHWNTPDTQNLWGHERENTSLELQPRRFLSPYSEPLLGTPR